MRYRSLVYPIFLSLLITGCNNSKEFFDTATDIVYLTTGVPGEKHKKQRAQKQAQAKESQEDYWEKQQQEKTNAMKQTREKWVGKHVDDLVESWGKYTESYQRKDGTYQYAWVKTQQTGGMMNFVRTCRTTFFTNKKGIIQRYEFNPSSCFY